MTRAYAVLACLIASVLALSGDYVSAQDADLSLQDLRASFCFGYFVAQAEEMRRICATPRDDSMAAFCRGEPSKQIVREQAEKLERVKAYLIARGIMFSPDISTSTDFLMSVTQGQKDVHECVAWGAMQLEAHTQPEQACFNRCEANYAGDAMKGLACMKDCGPDACKKSQACETMDYLPW